MSKSRSFSEEKKSEPSTEDTAVTTTGFSISYEVDYDAFKNYCIFTGYDLGEGKFGVIHEARWNGQRVAVKELHYTTARPLGTNECSLEDCQRESGIMQTLKDQHTPNVLNILACCHNETEQKYYIVTEYMPKGSLAVCMATSNLPTSPWEWNSRYSMMRQITHAIVIMHANNILHRDIKGDNILLDNDWHPMLADFGFANFIGKRMIFCGTPGWMAPETLQLNYAEKTDIYSLAVLFWEIAVGLGVDPFPDLNGIDTLKKTLRGHTETIPTDCPLKVAKLITWGWQKDPKDRPTAVQMEKELSTGINEISETLSKIKCSLG